MEINRTTDVGKNQMPRAGVEPTTLCRENRGVLGWIPSRGICLFSTFVLLFGITASLSEDEQL